MPNTEHKITEGEIKEIWERLTKDEASIKSAHHRIDNLQEMSKSIQDLALSTAQIAAETKALREDYVRADERIEILENKPIKRYETALTAFITAIFSGVAGYVVGYLANIILR